jgi:hypothetical protein
MHSDEDIASDGSLADFGELFDFYYDRFKLLYSDAEARNKPPLEVQFEIHAAFDHLSRYWKYHEPKGRVIDRVRGHLKRACFDLIKVRLSETREQYDELRKIDTSVIDNGEYEKNLHKLWHDIRIDATQARHLEGKSTDEAFSLWDKVDLACAQLEKDFYLHEKVDWAKQKDNEKKQYKWKKYWKELLFSCVVSFIFGVVGTRYADSLFKAIGL